MMFCEWNEISNLFQQQTTVAIATMIMTPATVPPALMVSTMLSGIDSHFTLLKLRFRDAINLSSN